MKKSTQPDRNEIRGTEAVFDYATIGMIIANAKGIITNFNRCAADQFGYSAEEVIGQPIEILLPDHLKKGHIHLRDGFMKSPGNRPMGASRDLFARRKDNSVFPVEISLSHFRQNDELFIIAFVIDISIRKKNEAELAESANKIRQINSELEQKIDGRTKMLRETLSQLETSRDELNQALRKERELSDLKSRFVTLASHEFRTPLSAVLSSASIIDKYVKEEDHDKRNKHVNRIKDAVGNMRDILEDFLSLGKLEEGLINVNVESISSETLQEELSRTVTGMDQLTKPGQKMIIDCKVSGVVELDKKLLFNIVSNLLSNAIKFSPEDSEIHISCLRKDNDLQITIKDNGIGISEEDQKHLFERFFRAQNASNIQGTGLGLNIVLKYLELMNGKIECHSKINEGTSFVIHIPQ